MADPLSINMMGGLKPGMKEIRKEGYLWKINKKKKRRVRKYFQLVGGSLTWTMKPTDINPLGKIPVSSAHIRATSSYEFTITGTKNGREKEYLLAAQNPEETRAWMEAIIASQGANKSKVGWLVFGRERKRAWFLFQKSILYWFSKEQDPSGDFRKHIEGVVKLAFYNVNVVSENSFELQDFLPAVAPEEEPKGGAKKLSWDDIMQPPQSTPRRVFTFTCKSKDELLGWVQAFQDDITKHRKRVNAGTEHYGWLKAKELKGGHRRLFFYLRGGRLAWYRSAEDWTEFEKGSLLLEQCQVKRELSEAKSFTIYNPSNAAVSITLMAEKEDDFQKWVACLEKSVETIGQKVTNVVDEVRTAAVNSRERVEMSGWLILKGKKKFFKLKADVLLYFEDEPRNGVESKLIDSIRLKDAVLTKKEFSFSIKTSDAKLYELSAHSQQEITEWIVSINAALQQARGIAYAQSKGTAVDPTLMSMFQADLGKQGWVTKEGKKRFLDLAPGRITELDTQFKPKRVVPLESASVSVIDATSFLLRTVDSSHVYVCPKEDTADWVKNISFYIIKANAAAATELEKKGWLLINGKSYWCGIKNAKFSWFPQQQLDTYQFPDKSTLNMQECKTTVLPSSGSSAAARFRFQIIPPTGKPVELRADSENEMNGWLKAFASCLEAQEQARRRTAAATLKTPVFGTDLPTLLASEKEVHRTQGLNAEIPYVIRRSIEYLDQPKAYETAGLWQTGGSHPKVREWTAVLNSGQELVLKDASFHDVTSLVKHFLRSLPEPLMTFALHDPLLDARSDPDKLAVLIGQLPEANKNLLKYLIKYLDKMTNQMLEIEEVNAVDLSMVFAPLLFRRKADPNEDSVDTTKDEEDLDLLKGVLVVGTIIQKYYEIFEGKKPTIKEALGLPEEAGEESALGNEVSLSSLDALLDNFLNGNTMGLDLTEHQINRLTLKRNALRSQQKQENNMNDWAKNLKVPPARKPLPDAFLAQDPTRNSAVADLDNLMGDLAAEKQTRSGSTSGSSTPAKPSGGARPPPKVQVQPGETLHRGALSDLDDLFEDLQTEKADRYRQDMPSMAEPSKGAAAAPEVNKLLTQVNNFRRESIAIRRTKADTRALVNALESLGDEQQKRKETAAGSTAGEKHRIKVYSDDLLTNMAWTLAVSERTTAREVVSQIGKKLPVEKEGNIMLAETDPATGNVRLIEADEIVWKLKGKLAIAVGRGYKALRGSTTGSAMAAVTTKADAERVSPGTSPAGSRKDSGAKDERKEDKKGDEKRDRKETSSSGGTEAKREHKTSREATEKKEEKEKRERSKSSSAGSVPDDKLRESTKSLSSETPRRKDKSSRRDGGTSPRSTHHSRQPSIVGPDDEFAALASSRHKSEKIASSDKAPVVVPPPIHPSEAAAIEDEIRRNEAERARLEAEMKQFEERRQKREKEKKEKDERERKEREDKERKEKEEKEKKEAEERVRKEKEEKEKEKREKEEKERKEKEEKEKREAEEKKKEEDRKRQEEKKKEEERKKKEEEDATRKKETEEKARKEEDERRRRAEVQRLEEEAKRKADEAKKKAEELKLKQDTDLQRARAEEKKRIDAQRAAQDESLRILKESMRTAAKGSGAVFSSVASSAAAQPTAEKNELKATIGEIDALLATSLPPTPTIAAATPPTPKSDPIKRTIGEIDALLAQPAIAAGSGSSSNLVSSAPPSSSSVISVEEESVVMTLPAKKAPEPTPQPNLPVVPEQPPKLPDFNPRMSTPPVAVPASTGGDDFDPRAKQLQPPPGASSSPATAPASSVRPEDVGCPPILIVMVNNNPKNIAITPGLTFQQVLTAIAKSKADEYEIVSTEGLMLAGEVALSFAGKKEAKCVLQKAEVLL